MAIYFDNFEGYNTLTDFAQANSYLSSVTGTFYDGQGEFGNRVLEGGLRVSNSSFIQGKFGLNIKTPPKESFAGFELVHSIVSNDNNWRVWVHYTGAISIYGYAVNSTSGYFITRSGPVISPNSFHTIEIAYYTTNSGGVIIYVDGVEAVRATGDLYYSSGGTLYIMDYPNGVVFDSFYISTGTYTALPTYGKFRCVSCNPDADTAKADWIGTYSDVVIDDTLDGDPVYTSIDSDVPTNVSEFSLTDVPATLSSAFMKKTTFLAQTTSPTSRDVEVYIDIGGTKTNGHTVTPTADVETYYSSTVTSGLTQTPAEMNAALVGVELLT